MAAKASALTIAAPTVPQVSVCRELRFMLCDFVLCAVTAQTAGRWRKAS
jgi:hypothetical protein